MYLLINPNIFKKYFKTQEDLEQKLSNNGRVPDLNLQKLVKNWSKVSNQFYLKSRIVSKTVTFKTFKKSTLQKVLLNRNIKQNPNFSSIVLRKSLSFLFLYNCKKLFCCRKTFKNILADTYILQNSLTTVQKYRNSQSYTEFFFFKFLHDREGGIQREKNKKSFSKIKTTNFLLTELSTIYPLKKRFKLNSTLLLEFDGTSFPFFRKQKSNSFITFTGQAFSNQKSCFDQRLIKSQLQKDVNQEKRHFLKIFNFNLKNSCNEVVSQETILNLSRFFTFEFNEKVYKSRNRSINLNFYDLEKNFFLKLNVKKFLFFHFYSIIVFSLTNDSASLSLIKHLFLTVSHFNPFQENKVKMQKIQHFFCKKLVYECFCFFAQKIEFFVDDAFSVSSFKKTFLPFLAIKEDLLFSLRNSTNFFSPNYQSLNGKLVSLKESKTRIAGLDILLNINNQISRVQNSHQSQISRFLNVSLETTKLSKTKYVLENSLILHYFFDSLIRSKFCLILARSKKDNRGQKKHLKQKSFRNLIFFNFFLDTKEVKKNLFSKKIHCEFWLNCIQKKRSFLSEIHISLFLFENELFLCFIKNTPFTNNTLFIIKKGLNFWLKTNNLPLSYLSESFNQTKTEASNSLSQPIELSPFFQKRSNVEDVLKTYCNFSYKIYTMRWSKKKAFCFILDSHFLLNYIQNLQKFFKSSVSQSPESLIQKLNPKIYAWCYTQRFSLNKQMVFYLDHKILSFLWRWACQRHTNKSKKWIRSKYFYNFYENKPLFGSFSKIPLIERNCGKKRLSLQNKPLYFPVTNNLLKYRKEMPVNLFCYLPYHLQVFGPLKRVSLAFDITKFDKYEF